MSSLPISPLDLVDAPPPMAPLTHSVISPENIALEARLNRAIPLSRLQLWKLKLQAWWLHKRLTRLGYFDLLERFAELQKQRAAIKEHFYSLKAELEEKPNETYLATMIEEIVQAGQPVLDEHAQLREQLKEHQPLFERYRKINQRIKDDPEVRQRKRDEDHRRKIQREEALAYEQLIISRFTQLGYCDRWRDKDGRTRVDEVKFSRIHITDDTIYYKISGSNSNSFFGITTWGNNLPTGVKIADLVKEETLFELSISCQRQVSARFSKPSGAWIVVHRLDTSDGLLNQVKYQDVMIRYPRQHMRRVPLCAGVAEHRNVKWVNLADYPQWLVAGYTGSGKSNFINSIICTLITLYSPEDVRLVLVDLKDGIEFTSYENLPHLHTKVIDNLTTLAESLHQLEAIMAERNKLMRGKAKSISEWNAKYPREKIPRLVCIVDEVASITDHGELTKRIIASLAQLTAKGRAAGIHIILSTQRPSVDVLDGRIKVNMAVRIVGRMPSHADSLTVLGSGVAKELAAVAGRMVMQIGPDPIPIQTPFIDSDDIEKALEAAMQYPKPEPIPIPSGFDLIDTWTPERIIRLSLNHLNGNITLKPIWEEIKDDGSLSRAQLRDMLEKIWGMDCIELDGVKYRIIKGAARRKALVPIEGDENPKEPNSE